MTLYPWVREDVEKFSFVTRTSFTKGMFSIFYISDGKEYHRRLPYRANRDQLLSVIEDIKQETNWHKHRSEWQNKKLFDTPFIIHLV